MAIKTLHHYTVISDDLESNTTFYCDIVGLEQLTTPNNKGVTQFIEFAFPGMNQAVVSVIDGNHPLKQQPNERTNGFQLHGKINQQGKERFATGPFEHICFSYDAEDFDTIKEKLQQHQFACREGFDFMPAFKQIWTIDPNGIKVEFLFECDNLPL